MQHSPYSSPPPCPMCVACTNKSHSNLNPAPPVPISPSPQSPNTNTNVYVSNLPKTVSDEWLQAEFGQFGLVTSAKVMSDHGKSKGYAFVQYTEPEMAAEAVAQMNGCYVGENCINVKFADRDKDRGISNRPSNNLYVSNLPLHFGVAELSDLFGCFGPVTSLVVLTEPNSENSRGVGLVRFYTVEDASVAIQRLNGVVLEGHNRPLEVKYAENQDEKVQRKSAKRYKKRSSRRREFDQEIGLNGEIPACGSIASTNSMVSETSTTSSSSSVGETNTTLLVWGLPPGVDEIFVYKLMAPYGAVLDVILDKSRNSASVHFRYYSDASDALDHLQGALVQDHQIQLAIHNPTTYNNGNYQNNHTCSP